MADIFDIRGKTARVTGGSRGIGSEIARDFRERSRIVFGPSLRAVRTGCATSSIRG